MGIILAKILDRECVWDVYHSGVVCFGAGCVQYFPATIAQQVDITFTTPTKDVDVSEYIAFVARSAGCRR
jgi:hypothetical protein